MSASTLPRIIDNALKTIGKNTGFKYKQYRPDIYTNPLQLRNYLAEHMVGVSSDEAFKKNPDELEEFLLYLDPVQVQVGDILQSEDLGKTYVVTDKMEL